MEQVQEFTKTLTTFDIVAGVVILLLGVRCLLRGFVKEIFSLAGLVGAVVISRMYHDEAAVIVRPWVGSDLQADVVAYAALGLGIILLASISSWLLSKLIKKTFMGFLDRLAGFGVGIAQGVLVVGISLLVTESVAGDLSKTFAEKSVIAPYLLDFVKFLSGIVFTKT